MLPTLKEVMPQGAQPVVREEAGVTKKRPPGDREVEMERSGHKIFLWQHAKISRRRGNSRELDCFPTRTR